ncbi:MOLPALP family lipoprotein [Spiroplasma endosymbiont of Stenodema calcarata]|uniref:MOLPALP family lipoprotein n=1 Tax=Spiroplasma endosymbiont of Stenodema calcarata TaxID=3139328 RepID=UPI003CCB2C52
MKKLLAYLGTISLLTTSAAPEGLAGILAIIVNGNLLSKVLSPSILRFANELLNQDTLMAFRDAFDDSIYENMTYQDVLTSGTIGLVNAVNELTGQSKQFDYKNKSNLQDDAKNYQDAISMFGTTIVDIMHKKISFKFNLINNLTAISEIIRFVRIVLNYLDQFDPAKPITWVEINTVRTTTYPLNTKIDFKKIINNLAIRLTSANGEGLRSLIAILFQSSEHHQIKPTPNIPFLTKENLSPAGLSALGKVIVNKYMPVDLGFIKVYLGNVVWDIINTISAKETLDDMVAFLNNKLISDQLPANIKPVIDKIKQNPVAIKDLFAELYQGDILGDIFKMFTPESTLVNAKNLKIILNEPLQNWMPTNQFTNIIADKSIVTVVTDLNQAITDHTFINTKDVYQLFNSLLTPTANNLWLLQDALLNPENFFSILGFKNKIIVDKSPLSYLKNILENVMGINGAFKTMTKYINDFNVKEQKIAATMYQTFNNLQVTVLAQTVDNIFEYQINNRIIKIGVEIVGDKYLINEITIN